MLQAYEEIALPVAVYNRDRNVCGMAWFVEKRQKTGYTAPQCDQTADASMQATNSGDFEGSAILSSYRDGAGVAGGNR